MDRRTRGFILSALIALFLPVAAHAAEQDCASLANAKFAADVGAQVTVTGAAAVAAANEFAAYCRLTATIAPAVKAEVRMPSRGWNGRLLVVGCGGLCGEIQMARTDDALLRGYAVATTDMGHVGTDIAFTADPAALADWSHRSTHVTTLLTKAAIKVFYGRSQDHAYYRGCSTGGRQGLVEALKYPEDFDGLIVGAPAGGLAVPTTIWQTIANLTEDGSKNILGAADLRMLHDGALGACDAADGLKDGVINDPLGCKFEPAHLQCKAGQASGCLSAAQVAAAKKIYGGIRTPKSTLTTIGSAVGTELNLMSAIVRMDGKPARGEGTAANTMRANGNANPKLSDYDFDVDPLRATDVSNMPLVGPQGDTLAGFKARNGKMILYSGWADPLISPAVAMGFYQHQAAALGGASAIDPFLRLYMVPGMNHCGGGDGADAMDMLTAIETWVEKGTAPASIVATKAVKPTIYPNEYRFPIPADNVAFARPVFPYPAYAQYDGKSDPKAAASFKPAISKAP